MSKWIRVGDSLPNYNQSVLASDGEAIGYCHLSKLGHWVVAGQNIRANPMPTHWMPLPEPPEDLKDE